MAGHELASEGFAPGQVGSSVMPHKMNARSCERISGFRTLLNGYLVMASELSGKQWNEGDVSCSVVRRVMLPDAFFAIDGLLETFITVLDQMEVYPSMIEQEARRYLPFLATTTILMEATKAGAGREDAHAAIKQHSLAVAKGLRSGEVAINDLPDRLAGDERLRLSRERIDGVISRDSGLTGMAREQGRPLRPGGGSPGRTLPEAASYKPGHDPLRAGVDQIRDRRSKIGIGVDCK
jgi:adenylosuccinate lyase